MSPSPSELVVRAPFGGQELARIRRPSAEEVEEAVRCAVAVFEKTRSLPTFTRVAIL
jgi:acyl-CoA reductase-like NAD-dependent aldehyde dehydrogenase